MKHRAETLAAKAEAHYHGAMRDVADPVHQGHDLACGNAHLCAEKYLKAFIVERGGVPGHTHDLEELLDTAISLGLPADHLFSQAGRLTLLGSEFRYDQQALPHEAEEAIELAGRIRAIVRNALGLPGD